MVSLSTFSIEQATAQSYPQFTCGGMLWFSHNFTRSWGLAGDYAVTEICGVTER